MSVNKSLLIPLFIFVLLVVLLGYGFSLKDPHLLPSQLVDQRFPEFSLADLHGAATTRGNSDIIGSVALVNVWATWCPNCLVEHPELTRIANEENVPIIGINYNDDSEKARAWLVRHGDPYAFHIVDDQGRLAIDLGVYGAPETFVVDAEGVIRYRHVGTVTNLVWEQMLEPIISLLKDAAG